MLIDCKIISREHILMTLRSLASAQSRTLVPDILLPFLKPMIDLIIIAQILLINLFNLIILAKVVKDMIIRGKDLVRPAMVHRIDPDALAGEEFGFEEVGCIGG